jgi:stress-induced-phosphoprotein 1
MSRNYHAEAEDAKTRGNECLANKDFDTAVKWYTQALDFAKHVKEGNNRHVYYSNRSAAYLSKGFAESAMKDAEACIREKPDWPKGYGRKGAALHSQKKYAEAVAAYEAGLAVAPEDASLKKGSEDVIAERDSLKGGGRNPFGAGMGAGGGSEEEGIARMFSDPSVLETLKSDPKTSAFMQDANFLKTLELIQAQPSALGQLLQMDKRLIVALGVVLGVNIKDPEERKAEEEKRQKEEAERERKRAEERETAKRAAETPEERANRERIERAKAYKDAGNAHYKKKEFDQALAEYEKALTEDPTDMTYHLNRASVLLEKQDLEQCLAACDKAIETGRANGAKYEQIAKAYERRGNAFVKADRLQEALAEYRRAQLEFRSPDIDDRIAKVDKTLKQRTEKAYVNPELGQQASEKGNAKLVAGDFPAAVAEFTEAIARDPRNANHRVDRCAAYTKLMDFGRAQEDVDKAIELDPKLIRAYARRGKIETFTKQYHKALTSYRKGLQLDPNDQDCADGLRIVEAAIQSQSRKGDDADGDAKLRSQRAMEDPEIRSIMQDPVMAQVLRDLSSDPKSARQHLSNPGVSEKIEKLIAAGILKMA